MKFIDTSLSGVIKIEPVVHGDNCGFFLETWHSGRFADHSIDANLVQDNFSRSGRGVIIPFLVDAKSRCHAAFNILFGGKPPLAVLGRS